ncbi:MAG: ExbD/TolR family protein [Planctomycetota bacterium]
MKIRGSRAGEDKIQLQMTPMIDIVFQLLVFFIMTFKIVAQEGDFQIKMPLATQQSGLPEESPVLTMHVRLRAAPDGQLLPSGGIVVNGELVFDTPAELHNYVISIVGGDEPATNDAEVELDCDYGLNYEHVIEAITAVSGYVDKSEGEGTIKHLIQKIKFAPPPEAPE